MAAIGYGTYDVYVSNAYNGTPLVGPLPFTTVEWQRTRNATSQASVVLQWQNRQPFDSLLSSVSAWTTFLDIRRNGVKVWDGPITGWTAAPDSLTLRAHDRSVLMSKRLVAVDITATATDLWTIVDSLFGDANLDTGNPFTLTWSTAGRTSGLVLDREYRVNRLETIERVIATLAESAGLSWTQLCGVMHLDETAFWVPQPVLHDAAMHGGLTVEFDALGLASEWFIGDDSGGVTGFATRSSATDVTYGASGLQAAITAPRVTAELASGAAYDTATLAAFEGSVPKVALQQVRLHPTFGADGFPEDLSQLVPGMRCKVVFPDMTALDVPVHTVDPLDYEGLIEDPSIQTARLEQLDVSVSAGGGYEEQLLASFIPVAT